MLLSCAQNGGIIRMVDGGGWAGGNWRERCGVVDGERERVALRASEFFGPCRSLIPHFWVHPLFRDKQTRHVLRACHVNRSGR